MYVTAGVVATVPCMSQYTIYGHIDLSTQFVTGCLRLRDHQATASGCVYVDL